jgi:hypothetical protein
MVKKIGNLLKVGVAAASNFLNLRNTGRRFQKRPGCTALAQ